MQENSVQISFKELAKLDYSSPIFILVNDKLVLSDEAKKIDIKLNGLITSFLQNKDNFAGKLKDQFTLTVKIDDKIHHIILVGLGDLDEIKSFQIEEIGALISNIGNHLRAKNISVLADHSPKEITASDFGALIGAGIEFGSYRFQKYQTTLQEKDKSTLLHVQIVMNDYATAQKKYEEFYHPINKGVFLTRNLANEPANILHPESYAQIVLDEMKSYKNIEMQVLGKAEMQKLGMGALLGVGQGSARESKLVIIKYNGNKTATDKPIALVGKGVTFDTGGISLKPSLNMEQMKYDMTGSACVVGAIKALAERSAKVNIVGILALVENMPDANAQRPGDIVKSMSGKTIEVLNTDAEGRLILADALTYVQQNFDPKLIIDLATLTGAIGIALGNSYAGCFANDDMLSHKLLEASAKVNERLWRMPLDKEYHDVIKSECADIANVSWGSGGGSCTAAAFLEKFIDEKRIWAHLDIASVSWSKKGQKGANFSGASGFGVRLLNQFIHDNHEDKA